MDVTARVGAAAILLAVCVAPAIAQEPETPAAFSQKCETCHGKAAKGANAPALVPFDAELSELVAVVRQGVGMMPAMSREEVTDADIEQIYKYLKALSAAKK